MEARVESHPLFPSSPGNPYPLYRELRERDPVHFDELLGVWMLTRHADCAALLKDARFSADRTRSDSFERLRRLQLRRAEPPRSMLNTDPPDHTRLRTLVNKAFTSRTVEGLRPRVQAIVDALLDAAEEKGRLELVEDLAYPLPVTVIAELLGVPPEDQDRFREWSRAVAVLLEPIPDDDAYAAGLAAQQELFEYFGAVIARRRTDPRDDLVSALAAAEEHGDALSAEEMLVMCNLLLIAGHETTVNLIGNGVLALLSDDAALSRLRAEPAVVRTGVEELLRYDGPVGITGRVATEEVEIGGKTVRPRQSVVALLLAANRDPAVFPDPDRLVLDRHPNPHLAFGGGIHFCLGAPLARLEGRIAIETLVRRYPKLALAEEPEWRPQIVLRGLRSLHLAI